MNTSNTPLESRVEKLERRNRMLVFGLVAALVIPALTGMRRDAHPDDIVVKRVRVVDDEGRVRIDLRHNAEETGMFVLDEEGQPRIGAAQFSHGGGGFALHGPGGQGGAVLYLRGDGSLTMYDAAGEVTARFPER
ncbi:MAG: hypothetical protein OEN56_01760 [Gemmatimonadota bacterium]|nr:hypothetical protein [Gemmatimonadota bacterium]MDH3424055.1 hypothetical protein [Gemmatimonadota bacterium]